MLTSGKRSVLPFESSSPRVSFFVHSLIRWLRQTAPWTKSHSFPPLTTVLSLKRYLKSLDCPHIGRWSRMCPNFASVLWNLLIRKYDICNCVSSTSCHRGGQYKSLYWKWFFISVCRKKPILKENLVKTGYHSQHGSCHLFVETFSDQIVLKNK